MGCLGGEGVEGGDDGGVFLNVVIIAAFLIFDGFLSQLPHI